MTSRDTIIQEDGFGFAPRRFDVDSEEKPFRIVRRYTMTNKNEASVRLISWGAGIQSVIVPNNRGVFGDVVMGFDNMEGYSKNRYIGRVINGFADNSVNTNVKNCTDFETGKDVNFRVNEKFDDFDSVNWESCISGQQVIMSYVSRADKREALGNMLIQVKYSWTDKNELNVNIRANVAESTPANITIFCPMNLAGHATGPRELKNHVVTINSDNFVSITPGKKNWSNRIDKVDGTFYDLRNPTSLKNRLHKIPGGGYDHIMRINSPSDWYYRFHGRILHPDSGRFLEIYSNKANLKFSTVNNFPDTESKYPSVLENYTRKDCGDIPDEKSTVVQDKDTTRERIEIRGKDGALYRRNGGFVFSPRHNFNEKSIFPNCILHPGQTFVHDMSYKFGIKSTRQ